MRKQDFRIKDGSVLVMRTGSEHGTVSESCFSTLPDMAPRSSYFLDFFLYKTGIIKIFTSQGCSEGSINVNTCKSARYASYTLVLRTTKKGDTKSSISFKSTPSAL